MVIDGQLLPTLLQVFERVSAIEKKLEEHDEWERTADTALRTLLADHESRLREGERFRHRGYGIMAALGFMASDAWQGVRRLVGG